MAITHIEYALIQRLADEKLFPSTPSILELGQSNWYGDVPLDTLAQDAKQFAASPEESGALVERLRELSQDKPKHLLFKIADVFWETFLGPHTYMAIDLHGVDERAHKFDLNEPVPIEDQFDVVCNFGTAEHIFNVYQVFKTVHERTKPGGLMLHGLPFQGWVDHGFYNFQPTFYFDLAAANEYAPVSILYAEVSPPNIIAVVERSTIHGMVERGEIGANAMMFAVFRKPENEHAFVAPQQGYYARTLDKDSAERWQKLR